ncbi:BREX system ATP-binding domain-containing protein [Chloroflexota bacterium]
MDDINKLDPLEAETIIESFRQGTVPQQYLSLYSVGRERWLNSVSNDLLYITNGKSKVRFISAPYGGGKTHFCMLIKDRALISNFVLSYVELHSREAPFDRFEVIFPKIMRGVIEPNGNNIEYILENWATNFRYYNAKEIEEQLRILAPSLDFRAALRTTLQYMNTESPEHTMRIQSIVAWLQGYHILTELKGTGIRANITVANVNEILGSFLRLIRGMGYSGLVLLLDEADAITSLTQSKKRDEANQNIRKLLDNADEHSGLYVLFATTPKFLNDPKAGAQSYHALWTRIKDVVGNGLQQASSRSTVMILPPLDRSNLEILTNRIIDTHLIAYEWDARKYVDEAVSCEYIDKFSEQSDPYLIRVFIRTLVYILDMAEEERDAFTAERILDRIEFD